jgi:hypothetical protein
MLRLLQNNPRNTKYIMGFDVGNGLDKGAIHTFKIREDGIIEYIATDENKNLDI